RKQLTIPRMLKQADPEYVTAHFGKWDLRTDEPVPEDMGYDVSDGYTNNQTGGGKSSGGMEPVDDPKLVYSVTKRACDFIETQAQRNKPFYLQVSHYAVHLAIFYSQASLDECSNFQPGKKHTMPEFAAMTSDLDNGIAALIDKIADLGLTNNTYIFFMSDNGGRYDMPGQKNKQLPRNDPLRQGKGTMYEGGIRVPFVIAGPGVKPAVVSDVPVSGLDILPTLADLAGYDQPLPKALDGGSLRNVISNAGKGRVKRNNPFMIFHHAVDRSPQTAIIRDPFKLVKTWEDDQLELFDLSKDIGEENDLSEKMPAKTRDLHDQMTSFLKKVNAETAWTKK
ncbi:MAG: sulfatase-like hydrolase/transferase, partial [Planctomycetes bacterium]|nr:sulfatase-like hydrolase/transferase [Planctomycetota bacterium]